MKTIRLEDSTIPFVPTQIIISSNGTNFDILDSWVMIKWNNFQSNEFGRITNKEWALLFTHKKTNTQVLIAWVFTNCMPIQMSLKKFVLKYISTYLFYDEQWKERQVVVAPKARFGIVDQIYYSKEELQKTMKQFDIKKSISPLKYRSLIRKRIEYNAKKKEQTVEE